MTAEEHRGPQAPPAPGQEPGSDGARRGMPLSIHPNPAYYVQTQGSPYDRIKRVIDASDGGVIGLTGDRGAGKSVMLNRLAADYSATHLTINLSAPVTAGQDMAFFLMLFRYLVQQVLDALKKRGKESLDDIHSLGIEAVRRRFRLLALSTFVFTVAGAFLMVSYLGAELRDSRIEVLRSQLVDLEESFANPPDVQRQLDRAKIRLGEEIKAQREASWPYMASLPSHLIWPLITVAVLYVLLIVLALQFRRTRRRLKPDELGLAIYSERLAHKLDYELTRSYEHGIEASPFSFVKLGSKVGGEEKARPLSLPELTIKYIDYVCQVLKVFPDKILVCIDELDKVSDVEQVAAILREIKGALYVRGTYYVVSVSNDALRSFEGRFGDQRDVFESTFDDVFPVRPFDAADCVEILGSRLNELGHPLGETSPAKRRSLLVVALFSAGNARDLVRGFRDWILVDRPFEGGSDSPGTAWLTLFQERLASIEDRVTPLLLPEHLGARFAGLIAAAQESGDSAPLLYEKAGQFVAAAAPSEGTDGAPAEAARVCRYAMELRILAAIRMWVADAPLDVDVSERAAIIMKSYQRLPFNPVESGKLLQKLPPLPADQGPRA